LSRTQNNLEETQELFLLDLDSPPSNAETRSQLVLYLQTTPLTAAVNLSYFFLSGHSRYLATGQQASKLYLLLGIPPPFHKLLPPRLCSHQQHLACATKSSVHQLS
jgi:hypothetical protein